MILTSLVLSLALGQSDPYIRSRVTAGDTSSQCLFWTESSITWQLSSVGDPLSSDAQKQNEFTAIRKAVQSWESIFESCGNLRFSEGPLVDDRQVGYVQGGDNHNLFLFRSQRCSDVAPSSDPCWTDDTCGNAHDCWDSDASTIALTLTTYDQKSGIIYDSDIQLNASGFVFTTADKPVCTAPPTAPTNVCVYTDVQNTMTHELGHFVGLDHTNATGSVMNPRAPPGETSKRTIDDGSRNFVCLAYPKGMPSQSCITPTVASGTGEAVLGQYISGCSSTGPGGALPLLAASALWLLRRRREAVRP